MINGLNKVRRGIASFSLVMIIAGFFAVSVAQAATFSDVQPSDWFSPYVEQLAADGILNTTTGTYRPADLVNRAEMAKLAVEAFKLTLENPETPTFKDVPKGSWFYQYVETAAKNGIVGGYKDQTGTLTGYFGPGDSLTREQAMKILVLAAPLTTNTKGGPHFSDVPASAWSYEYVETGYNWSVVDGYADGSFNPTKNINRAEIAKMVVNAMNPVVREGSAGYEIASVTALNATTVEVCYSVEADATAAADKANYSIKDSSNSVLAVDSATVSADGMCVELTTGTQQAATVYTLLITGVKSVADEELVTNSISFNGYSVNANGGDLTVSTDDSSPKGITLPGAVSGVPVFSFNVAAGSNDVTITSIELHRGGTGVDASVANVAIFDEANRVSKAKTFNSSTDTATVSLLSGGLVVKAGATKKLTVVATVGSTITPNVAGSEFSIEVAKAGAIASNAKTITGTFPVSGNMFKVGSSDSGVITWLDNGAPSNPKLGALQAEVSKFKLRNESNDNEMLLNGVTVKELSSGVNVDTETENWSLWIEGTKVAETAKSSSRYITFKLTTPYSIKSSKTINLVVKTDITGGAGKTLRFGLDNSLDLSATDTKYGYGAKVCYDGADATCTYGQTGTGTVGTDYDEEVVTVQAGEVAIVSTDATNTDILKNKKNVVAGTLKVTTKAGLNLELQKIGVTVTNNDPAASADAGASCSVAVGTYDSALRCLIENVELYDVKTGSVYDLSGVPGAAVKTFTYADGSVTIPLTAGETREFQVRFDTLNRNITGGQLVFALNGIGATGTSFYLVETGDNQAVSDITPASISFKTLNGVAATSTVSMMTQSATKNVVIGGKGLEVLSAQIDAGNASSLKMTEFKAYGLWTDNDGDGLGPDAANDCDAGLAAPCNANNKTVNALYLYKVAGDGTKTLLSTKSGSNLAAGVVTFDGLNETIAANGSMKLLVTIDVVDDSTKATDTLNFRIAGIRLADYDNDDVLAATVNPGACAETNLQSMTVCSGTATSARVSTIVGVGTIANAEKTDDSAVNYQKTVIGGATSDFVAAYEFTAQNEPILVKDLTIVNTGVAGLQNSVAELVLFKSDKTTEIARKAVTGDTTVFTNINYTVALGSEKIYVKVVTHKIGLDESGNTGVGNAYTLTAQVTKADGADSGKSVIIPAASGNSLAFTAFPVKVSTVAFVNTATVNSITATVTNPLISGENVIGIIAVTADPSTNTNQTTGAALKTQLTTFDFDALSGAAGNTLGSMTISRLGGGADNIADVTGAVPGAVSSDMTACPATPCAAGAMSDQNWQIANGTIAYYVVKATNTPAAGVSDYAQIKWDSTVGLNAGILYDTDELLGSIGVMMASDTLDGPSLPWNSP